MALRTKLLLGLTFLFGIGVGLLLQSCVVGVEYVPVPMPPEGVTVGGGVTGRWEGNIGSQSGCNFLAGTKLTLHLIQDSNANITGSAVYEELTHGINVVAVLGTAASGSITLFIRNGFSFGADLHYSGTIVNDNLVSGTFDTPAGAVCSGTWSVTRVPPI